jgi:hypothetical protein
MKFFIPFILICCALGSNAMAQQKANDTIAKKTTVKNPRVAAIRSAILPGLGQAYNKKYWKIPIVYAALGTTVGFFVYNNNNYKKVRYATKIGFQIRDKKVLDPITMMMKPDSTGYDKVAPELKALVGNVNRLVFFRGEFRRDMDYSVLAFVLVWGLQVAEATVDAHLSSFDVSNTLSLNIKPISEPINNQVGFAVALNKHLPKSLPKF